MAFDITKPEQATLTPEEKAWLDGQLGTARETAVTEFKTKAEEERKKLVPEKYELKFGDNSPLDPKADLEATSALAKELGLTNEQAAKLLTHQETLAGGVVARQQQQFADTRSKWADEVKADKEIGGTHFDATLTHVKRAMEKFAPEGSKFRVLVEESGYGNHPEFVRVFAAIGKAMAEDSTILGGGAPVKKATKSVGDILYGDS
jgi:hypothetical protein